MIDPRVIKLITVHRLTPGLARALVTLLDSDLCTYDDLSEQGTLHSVRTNVHRLAHSRMFEEKGWLIHNASKVGYFIDVKTRGEINDILAEKEAA